MLITIRVIFILFSRSKAKITIDDYLMALNYLESLKQFFLVAGQQHKVQCSENTMKVLVALSEPTARVYLEGLNGYKNEKCEPKMEDNLAVFELSLINFYDCGIIRVVNKLTVSD